MQDFDELIIRFLDKKTTREETSRLLKWIEDSEENRKYFTSIHSVWVMIQIERANKSDSKQINKIVKRSIKSNRSSRKVYLTRGFASIAAIFLFLVMMKLFFTPQREQIDYLSIIRNTHAVDEITIMINPLQAPQRMIDKVITLSDSIARLSHSHRGDITINDTLNINDLNSSLNTIRIPYGKRSILTLADHTTVHLNSGSTLIYPSVFRDNIREVFLDGEAFFDVQKDQSKPFVVKTLFKTIDVLGTAFNVSVDKDSDFFEAVLVRGSIGLDGKDKRIELFPNQYYRYTPSSKTELIKEVDVTNYTSWIYGKLKFKKEPISKAIKKIEKNYNVSIKLIDEHYADQLVSGELNLKDSVDETIMILTSILVSDQKQKTKKIFEISPNY